MCLGPAPLQVALGPAFWGREGQGLTWPVIASGNAGGSAPQPVPPAPQNWPLCATMQEHELHTAIWGGVRAVRKSPTVFPTSATHHASSIIATIFTAALVVVCQVRGKAGGGRKNLPSLEGDLSFSPRERTQGLSVDRLRHLHVNEDSPASPHARIRWVQHAVRVCFQMMGNLLWLWRQ
jgi:hypothetical protein